MTLRIDVILIACLLAACHTRPAPILAPPVVSEDEPAPPVAETLDAMLYRTEGQHCGSVIEHREGDDPDCRKIYDAFLRGRNRVVAVYPEAAALRMSLIYFYRPQRYYVPERHYPLILDPIKTRPGMLSFVRGYFWEQIMPPVGYGAVVYYSYEEVVEHETVHALMWLTAPTLRRTEEARSQSDSLNREFTFVYQVSCHGTPDDPFGEPGNAASCIGG